MLSKRTQIERDRERKVTVWVWRGLGKGKSSENTPCIRKQGKREKKMINCGIILTSTPATKA